MKKEGVAPAAREHPPRMATAPPVIQNTLLKQMQVHGSPAPAPLAAALLLVVLAGSSRAQPCPTPAIKTGFEPASYRGAYNAHDCICGPPLGLQKNQAMQCRVDADTVHVEGTAQCTPDGHVCFLKNQDPLNPDSDVFAQLPAACRPSTATYKVNATLWAGNCNVKCDSFGYTDVSINSNGSMHLSGGTVKWSAYPQVPGSDGPWCMMIKTSFPKHPPPAPPLSAAPCIRFGHTVPVSNHVDVQITQGALSHTWTDYAFGQFSDWVNVFKPGSGDITIWENLAGTRGGVLYQMKGIPLTPGPLVVALKVASSQVANASGYWPPTLPDSIETIAASYVQGANSSKVRLFNLSPDTEMAGMAVGGSVTASGIAYSLGSQWTPVPAAAGTFTFSDSATKKTLATKTETPPAAPLGFTNVLLGLQSGGAGPLKIVPLVDAPEGGTCHP